MTTQPTPFDPAALQAQFKTLHDASRAAPLSLAQRRTYLIAISQALSSHAQRWCEAIDADYAGRSHEETLLLELSPSQQTIKHTLAHLKRWAAPRKVGTGIWYKPAKNRIIPQPLGVVGVVAPWNYPLYIAIAPAIGALAAGNRVLIKMSEHTPRTAQLMADMLASCLPADVCQVVQGGVDTAQAFCALPLDHLLFTGATALGPSVMGAAAKNLTPVTLELGGKSPAIVGATANIAQAARRIAVGKWRHAGQTCIAPDYVLVHRSQLNAFIAQLTVQAGTRYPDALNNREYSSVVNERQFARLSAWMDQAIAGGAQLHTCAPEWRNEAAHRMAPVVLTGVPLDCKLMQEEIFGPPLPVLPYDTLEEAIAFINGKDRPLGLYVFETEQDVINTVLTHTVAGGVSINETIMHIAQEELPFGGVGASGMGHYHGQWGFDTFSKLKPVFYQSRFNALGLLDPPYRPIFYTLVKKLSRT